MNLVHRDCPPLTGNLEFTSLLQIIVWWTVVKGEVGHGVCSGVPIARAPRVPACPLPGTFFASGAGLVGVAVPPTRAAAYLCDPAAVHGSACLFLQLERILRCADAAGIVVPTACLYVDSGWPDGGVATGASLKRLMLDAKAGAVPLVFVDLPSRFSKDPEVAAWTMAALHAFGVPFIRHARCPVRRRGRARRGGARDEAVPDLERRGAQRRSARRRSDIAGARRQPSCA